MKLMLEEPFGDTYSLHQNITFGEKLDSELNSERGSETFSETTSASGSNCFVEDIAAGAAVPPVQPKHIKFPAVVISGKSRCFLTKRYDDYKWLEYYVSYDAMFCYPCRFFAIGNRRAEKTFTEHGYRNWKHAQDALKRHDSCVTHKDAMLSWEQYKRDNANQTSVAHLLDSHREKKIHENRHYN